MLQGLKARIPKVSASLLQPLACKAPVGFKDCQTLFIFRGMEEGKGRTKDRKREGLYRGREKFCGGIFLQKNSPFSIHSSSKEANRRVYYTPTKNVNCFICDMDAYDCVTYIIYKTTYVLCNRKNVCKVNRRARKTEILASPMLFPYLFRA
jgi:hypothetical protein